jgi:hypothetical protein
MAGMNNNVRNHRGPALITPSIISILGVVEPSRAMKVPYAFLFTPANALLPDFCMATTSRQDAPSPAQGDVS